MTCDDLRDLLPLHAYGDLSPDEAGTVDYHLAGCAACRTELAGYADVRQALGATPVPAVTIDAGRLLADAATRQMRRWRRLAFTASALAAGLLALVASQLELRVAWRNPGRQAAERVAVRPLPKPENQGSPELDERLRLLDELTRALAADIDERDARRTAEIATLRTRLDALQRATFERWQESRRDFDAIYTAQFKPVPKGDSP